MFPPLLLGVHVSHPHGLASALSANVILLDRLLSFAVVTHFPIPLINKLLGAFSIPVKQCANSNQKRFALNEAFPWRPMQNVSLSAPSRPPRHGFSHPPDFIFCTEHHQASCMVCSLVPSVCFLFEKVTLLEAFFLHLLFSFTASLPCYKSACPSQELKNTD